MCACTLPAVYTTGTAGICTQVCASVGTGTDTDLGTGTGRLGMFDTTSTPAPETLISSVRHPYRYRECRYRIEHNLGAYQLFENMVDAHSVRDEGGFALHWLVSFHWVSVVYEI